MSKPKVLVTRPDVPVQGIDLLKEKCEVEIYDQDKPIERDALLKMIKGKDALLCLLTDPIDKEVIETAGPQLKAIATMSVGYDHIDTKTCKEKNIPVSNTPDVSTDSVAEMTVTLLLAAGRRLIDAAKAIKNGEWVYAWSPLWLCGQGLTNATVGIVGMGRIGQGVMKRILPFGVSKVLYFDVFHPIKPAEDMGAQYVEFEELVKQSDFIVAMCNLSEQTRNLFNKKAFDLMKPTAVFVNTSSFDTTRRQRRGLRSCSDGYTGCSEYSCRSGRQTHGLSSSSGINCSVMTFPNSKTVGPLSSVLSVGSYN
ncbi:Glyoxylate reductase/hydroxypyruvate reductase [Araneus ventricosus]|uniref:Glyoxylate reductase/hydroxypyruvate reductase n=1 Tax=Araneus ventricosus TaxID=182803 RepID=A0A4Y2ILY3_ARAVE|nr:Glyoxylate reductase/hydroxypyruvate reductase [Araneus ventricosus]